MKQFVACVQMMLAASALFSCADMAETQHEQWISLQIKCVGMDQVSRQGGLLTPQPVVEKKNSECYIGLKKR